MDAEGGQILRIAEATSDDLPVDWDAAERGAPDAASRAAVRELQVVAKIAGFHRAQLSTAEAGVSLESAVPTGGQPPAQPGTWGHLRLLELVGSGSFGDVYRAWDSRLGREVALKLLHGGPAVDDQASAIVREGAMLARVRHPNVVAVYGAEEIDGQIGVWTEFVRGRTLARIVEEDGVLGAEEAALLMVTLCRAVAAVHNAGLLHRDVKAQNVIREEGGRIVLMDFGLGRDISRAGARPIHQAGTPLYMAPELLRDEAPSVQSDVYSIGVLLYYLVTASYPVQGRTADELLVAHERGAARLLHDVRADLPRPFVRVVERAIAADPLQRYASCGAMAAALAAVIGLEARTDGPEAELDRQPPAQEVAAEAATPPIRHPGVLALPGARDREDAQVRRQWSRRVGAYVLAGLTIALVGTGGVMWRWRASVPQVRNVVVLPCKPIGGTTEDQFLCDGLAATLTARLAQLTVEHPFGISPSSAVRDNGVSDARTARGELGATLVLEGSLVRTGSMLRLNYALVDTAKVRQLAAATFMAEAADLFTLHDQVIDWAVQVLGLELTGHDRRALTFRGTPAPDAYALYLQGRGYLLAYDDYQRTQSADYAIDLFQRALLADPQYAAAHAGLGEAFWLKYKATGDAGWVDRARTSCLDALRIDANLAAGHVCLGVVYDGTGEVEQALEALRHALILEPTNDDAYLHLARVQQHAGRWEDAEATYLTAIERRPQYWGGYAALAYLYRQQARYGDAIKAYEQVVTVAPDHASGFAILGGLYAYMGRYDDAILSIRQSMQIQPTYAGYVNLGMTYFRLRHYTDAVEQLDRACALRPSYQCFGNIGRAHYWAGQRRHARELLERAIALGEAGVAVNPRDPNVRLSLADYYAKLGRRDEAVAHLAEARTGEDPHLVFFAALARVQLEDRNAALDALEEAVRRGVPLAELLAWPELDVLREDDRFRSLIRLR